MSDKEKLTCQTAEDAAKSAGGTSVMTVEFEASDTIGVAFRYGDRNFAQRFGTNTPAEDVFDWVSSVYKRANA
jgi:hypothetical protein